MLQVANNELNDLEGFVMTPGQYIPVANENAIIILVVSASKIKHRFARRICHQKNGYCRKHRFSFLGRTVLGRIDKLLQYLSRSVAARFCIWQSRSASLDQCLSGKLPVLELNAAEPSRSA
jgi:hypothetical protein